MMEEPKFYLPTNDYIFKAMMVRNADLLQDFLIAVFPHLAHECRKISIADTELLPAQPDRKRASLDLKLYTADDRVIDIEMQVCNEKGLTKRMLFYIAQLYCNELNRSQSHIKLKNVISLWICKFSLFEDDDCFHDFVYRNRKHDLDFPESPELVILETLKFTRETTHRNLWLRFFAASKKEEFMELARQNPVMGKAWTFVHDMNMDDVERERALASERARVSDLIVRSEERRDAILERNLEIAKAMLLAGEPQNKILHFTNLTEQDLAKLQ